MIKQIIIKRNSKTVDEGTMGFHDYTTHKEPFEEFSERVLKCANEVCGKVINIAYPTEDLAIIVYKEKK